MTKYKSLYRAVQHLTVTDFQLNHRGGRRAALYRGAEPYGKTAAWCVGSGRIDGSLSGFTLPHLGSSLSSASAQAAGPPSR